MQRSLHQTGTICSRFWFTSGSGTNLINATKKIHCEQVPKFWVASTVSGLGRVETGGLTPVSEEKPVHRLQKNARLVKLLKKN